MKTTAAVTGSRLRTYESIFRQPAAHNLAWHDVRELLGELGHVAEEHNGHARVNRNGQTLTVHLPHTKEVADAAVLMELRHFIERSEAPAPPDATHWLVILNHHEARLFRSELVGNVPQKIQQHIAHVNSRLTDDVSRGREESDPTTFFGTIAVALGGTAKIILFGAGRGSGSEMEQFIAWSQQHHPALAARIIGTQVVDEHHLTEGQLLATAREFYAKVAPSLLR